jgi:6-methylsalicylate decarboxylase
MIQLNSEVRRKIDVHAHYLPPGYADEMRKAGLTHPDGMLDYPQWSPQLALDKYDEFGIETAMLSISSPSVHCGDNAAARQVNEAGADLVIKYPGRFGLFAVLSMPDVEASLEEIAYAFDVLHADGIGLKTNALGIYLGDQRFDPIFDELNRRKSTVFIHPTSPTCWQACAMGYPRPLIEFPFDTARAVTNLIFSGTMERCPDLRIIVSHNGGVVPFLADRITKIGNQLKLNQPGAQDPVSYMRRLYYDTAMTGSKYSLSSLLQLTDVSHILYGSDWPWYPEAGVQMTNQDLESITFLTEQDRRAIYRENALRFLPRAISQMAAAGAGK